MKSESICIVEDEESIAALLSHTLKNAGYTVRVLGSAEELLAMLPMESGNGFDLFILDLMLPGIDGLELCRRLRNMPEVHSTPIVMLTARNDDSDIVLGLEVGADLYLTKPFSPRVMVSRVRAVLRRRENWRGVLRVEEGGTEIIQIHDVEIDLSKKYVRVDGKVHDFSHTEFDILVLLARYPGKVFSRQEIIDSVKGSEYPVTERSIDVQIRGIRKKLGGRSGIVETVYGFGYRMKDELSDA